MHIKSQTLGSCSRQALPLARQKGDLPVYYKCFSPHTSNTIGLSPCDPQVLQNILEK